MMEELKADIAPFLVVHDRMLSSAKSAPSDVEASMVLAKSIVRKHTDFFVAFFVTWLSELTPELTLIDDVGVNFLFRSAEEAGDSVEAAIRQEADDALASSVCSLLLLTFLQRSKKNVGVTTEGAEASVRMIARMSFRYLINREQDFVDNFQSHARGKSKAKTRIWIGLLLGALLLWATLG